MPGPTPARDNCQSGHPGENDEYDVVLVINGKDVPGCVLTRKHDNTQDKVTITGSFRTFVPQGSVAWVEVRPKNKKKVTALGNKCAFRVTRVNQFG